MAKIGNYKGIDVPVIEENEIVTFQKNLSSELQKGVRENVIRKRVIEDTDSATLVKRVIKHHQQAVFVGSKNDGLTETVGAGSAIFRGLSSTHLNGASTDATLTSVTFSSTDASVTNEFDWDASFECVIMAKWYATATQDSFIGINSSFGTTVQSNATATGRHIGFFVDDATLYASVADGTTQKRFDVSSFVTITDFNMFRFEYDSNLQVRFYINEILVAQSKVNLPTGSTNSPAIFIGIQDTGAGTSKMIINNNYAIFIHKP